ncbi:MAG: ABC transporter permease subunit [Clostridiales Family XIII bacterium]|jgi:NitT/TauT family transport system permease protein|nr:ABC transporter permease subunit [Clostridiales Family XIII bacterium]
MKPLTRLLLPYLGAAAVIVNYYFVPDDSILSKKPYLLVVTVAIAAVYTAYWLIVRAAKSPKFEKIAYDAPKLLALFLAVAVWDILILKTHVLPGPFFQDITRILGVYIEDGLQLVIHALYSLRLLFTGYFIGLGAGFLTGVFAGWFARARYWIMPIVKLIGPIPATVWLPLIIIIMPTLFAGSVFTIAFGVWFPATLMTATGIMSVPSKYYEVAQTLGADNRWLLFHVALPSSIPNLFMGAFMGMGISCVALITAEMLGVKAGLGYFINLSTAWAEYNKVFAAIVVIIIVFSGVIALLFKANSKLLKWQKDSIQW